MAPVLSEPPEKNSPWSKYYAERGLSRPPISDLKRTEKERGPKEKRWMEPVPEAKPATPVSKELAEAIAAVTAAVPGSTAAPFITAMQKEAIAKELKRQRRRRLWRLGGWVTVAVLAVPVFVTFVINAEPSAAALERHEAKVAAELLALHSSPLNPLMTTATVRKPPVRVGFGHLRYEVTVTMRLRVPLYTVAHTNGTEAYRQIQRALEEAKERVSKLRLFKPPVRPPELPDMPLLLQLAHRMGEPVVVTVPFDAHRFGWRWRLDVPEIAGRFVNRGFDGLPLDQYAGSRTLIFGSPESLAEVRRLVKLARDYVTAAAKDERERAIFDNPAQEAAPVAPGAVATPEPAPPPVSADPNLPAVPPVVVPGSPRPK
jgi:hypothetical protein